MPRNSCTFLLQEELIIWTIYLELCWICCHMKSLNQNWMPFLKIRTTSLRSYMSGEGLTGWNSVICKVKKPVTVLVPFNTKIDMNQCSEGGWTSPTLWATHQWTAWCYSDHVRCLHAFHSTYSHPSCTVVLLYLHSCMSFYTYKNGIDCSFYALFLQKYCVSLGWLVSSHLSS